MLVLLLMLADSMTVLCSMITTNGITMKQIRKQKNNNHLVSEITITKIGEPN